MNRISVWLRMGLPVSLLLWLTGPATAQLAGYGVFFGETTAPPRRLVLRRWQQAGQTRYLTLDPATLETRAEVLPDGGVRPQP